MNDTKELEYRVLRAARIELPGDLVDEFAAEVAELRRLAAEGNEAVSKERARILRHLERADDEHHDCYECNDYGQAIDVVEQIVKNDNGRFG